MTSGPGLFKLFLRIALTLVWLLLLTAVITAWVSTRRARTTCYLGRVTLNSVAGPPAHHLAETWGVGFVLGNRSISITWSGGTGYYPQPTARNFIHHFWMRDWQTDAPHSHFPQMRPGAWQYQLGIGHAIDFNDYGPARYRGLIIRSITPKIWLPLWPLALLLAIGTGQAFWHTFKLFRQRRTALLQLCPQCGYNLKLLQSTACPECGAKTTPPPGIA